MDQETNTQSRIRHADRITLESDLLEQIDAAIDQVVNTKKGVRISRKDFVAYRIQKSPKKLSAEEIQELVDLFYDEERFLRQALKEVREAKARGEKVSVGYEGSSRRSRKPRRNRKPIPDAPIEISAQSTFNSQDEISTA